MNLLKALANVLAQVASHLCQLVEMGGLLRSSSLSGVELCNGQEVAQRADLKSIKYVLLPFGALNAEGSA
jgi:hypothetical protein